MAVVPLGQLVSAFCSTKMCEPWNAALVQHPWMTPLESIGPLLIAAPAAVPPATSASAVAPVITAL
jgi:hypothetical protein